MNAILDIVILAVEDVARAARFYQDAFGLAARVDAGVYVELALGVHGLGLYARDGFTRNTTSPAIPPPPAGVTTRTELYLRVDDAAAALARALAAGATSLSPLAPRPWGDDAAYVADPDGNVVVLAQRR